ncbi:IS4 family transposase [Legionella sp. W05-934-2]|uniref:IS4 family transposase n=1 Tax=Legionella sp. W05-934-2 TaxID=1198649 RepID=UPI003461E4D9
MIKFILPIILKRDAMHAPEFLHELLRPVMHLKRLSTLERLITGLLKEKKLSVTQLGRSIENKAQEKNNIKCSDRFLSNAHLWAERYSIYRQVTQLTVGTNSRPQIIVDWSHVPNTTCYILRAALVAKGRALTLYEEVFPKRLENNPAVHQRFLKKIKNLLPDTCRPIVITDAGFCKPWFHSVRAIGWDYIGRVRGTKKFRIHEKKTWISYKESEMQATATARYLGEGQLTTTQPITTHFYLIKLPKKYRVSLNKLKKKSHYKKDIEHSKSANEPWLIVASMKRLPRLIINIYASRMEIEEGFRDLKSSQFGFSFEHAYSTKIRRIQVLLMIAMLASFILYLLGWIAEENQWQYQFQANTYKHRRVLSLFYLGCRIIKKQLLITSNDIDNALQKIRFFCLADRREIL